MRKNQKLSHTKIALKLYIFFKICIFEYFKFLGLISKKKWVFGHEPKNTSKYRQNSPKTAFFTHFFTNISAHFRIRNRAFAHFFWPNIKNSFSSVCTHLWQSRKKVGRISKVGSVFVLCYIVGMTTVAEPSVITVGNLPSHLAKYSIYCK